MVDEGMKPLPLIASASEVAPAVADDGDKFTIVGCGLGVGGNG